MQELENVPGTFFDPVYLLNCDMYKHDLYVHGKPNI